jgi:hypothetical protein
MVGQHVPNVVLTAGPFDNVDLTLHWRSQAWHGLDLPHRKEQKSSNTMALLQLRPSKTNDFETGFPMDIFLLGLFLEEIPYFSIG